MLTIASRELQESSHHLLLAEVLHIVQVNEYLISTHLLKVNVVMDGSRLALHCGSSLGSLNLDLHGFSSGTPRLFKVQDFKRF